MTIDLIIKICGVLGFIISISTFILTRYEKRKKIEIELFDSSIDEFENIEDPIQKSTLFKISDSILKIKFTNLSQQPIILKPRTLTIKSGKYFFNLKQNDFKGMDTFDELMPPTSTREIGIFFERMASDLNIKMSKHYTEAKKYPLKVTVCDHLGKKFRNNNYTFDEAINHFYMSE